MNNRPHPFAAWSLDVWLVASLFKAVADAFVDAAGTGRTIWAAGGVLLVIVVPTLYHALWAPSARVLTFGERVVGRVFVELGKAWSNPYGTSRILLYVCVVYGLSGQFSLRPAASAGTIASFLMDLLLLVIAALSLILLGRGNPWALLGIVAHRALQRTADMPSIGLDSMNEVGWFVFGIHGETIWYAIVAVAVAHHYALARQRVSAPAMAA
jgi:hypothetical protein